MPRIKQTINLLQRVISLREINPNLKIVLSLGGWTESSGKFASLVAEKYNRKAFIDHAVTFLKLYRFDGLDIAWFFPVCWHGDCDDSDFAKMSDLENFAEFLRELRKAFDQSDSRLILTATVTGDPLIARRCYDFTALAELNYVNVMTFDYSAYWQEKTGHQAPLFSEKNHFPEQDVVSLALCQSIFNALSFQNNTIHFYIRKGIPRWKIILGIPAFGRSFTLADSHDHGLQSPVVGPGRVGEFTAAEGLLAFYEVIKHAKECAAITNLNGEAFQFSLVRLLKQSLMRVGQSKRIHLPLLERSLLFMRFILYT